MEQMLVTQGLNELKLLESRISRGISDAHFVTAAKTSDSKVNPSYTKQEFIANAKAEMQSIEDLIARRSAIKSAIVQSNAKTEVEINGQKMTVAQAIDLKTFMVHEKALLARMTRQYGEAVAFMQSKNDLMEKKLDDLVNNNFSKDSKQNVKPEDYDVIAKPYRAANEYSLVDPLDIDALIRQKKEYIEVFEASVDQILQISNCKTLIEF